MRDPDDVDFWSQYMSLDVSLSELVTLHDQLMYVLRSHRPSPEPRAEVVAIVEAIDLILLRTGAMTKEEIDEAHEEIDDGDE